MDLDPEYIFWQTAATCSYDSPIDGQLPRRQCSFGTGSGPSWTHSGTHFNGEGWTITSNARIDTDDNGIEIVNPRSDLGKMIVYGVHRDTDPGIVDINIMQTEAGGGPAWLGPIPFAGSLDGVLTTRRQQQALADGWVDGSIYCAGCRPEWDDKMKYLNQYIVDVGLYEGMGSLEVNPVAAFFDQYIYPNLDFSHSGVIARNMGKPKEWVQSTLAFMDDLFNTPQTIHDMIVSAPNIWFTHYGGWDPYEFRTVPEQDQVTQILATVQESSKISGVEIRRRFNSEAVA
jgi:hypothetical protein